MLEYRDERTDIPQAGEGCPLDEIMRDSGAGVYMMDPEEKVRNVGEGHVIVEAKDLKGYRIREMAVDLEHGEIPSEEEKRVYAENLVEQVSNMCFERDIPYSIFYGSMNSIPSHHHFIGCSLEPGKGDLSRLQD